MGRDVSIYPRPDDGHCSLQRRNFEHSILIEGLDRANKAIAWRAGVSPEKQGGPGGGRRALTEEGRAVHQRRQRQRTRQGDAKL